MAHPALSEPKIRHEITRQHRRTILTSFNLKFAWKWLEISSYFIKIKVFKCRQKWTSQYNGVPDWVEWSHAGIPRELTRAEDHLPGRRGLRSSSWNCRYFVGKLLKVKLLCRNTNFEMLDLHVVPKWKQAAATADESVAGKESSGTKFLQVRKNKQ